MWEALMQMHDVPVGPSGREATAGDLVDVIVPVHNALEDVDRCLSAALANTADSVRLIVVNDASGPETSELLRGLAERSSRVHLVENVDNLGYTRAANVGLRLSTAPYVVLLNSDTIVSAGWLDGLLRCATSAERIGIVGPLSNAATWQSVPELRDATGRFAVNVLPEGVGVADMAALVARCSSRAYPRVPFLNGFCLLIKRSVLETCGLFDEEHFPLGYGEENDLCVRARDAGFELVVADDVYVFHAKSKSYGSARRDELARAGAAALKRKHGAQRIESLELEMRSLEALQAMRAAVTRALFSNKTSPRRLVDWLSLRVLFLLPVRGGGGGAHSVVQEAAEMRRLGLYVRIAVRAQHRDAYCSNYNREIERVEELFVSEPSSIADFAHGFDVVVATAYTSIELLETIVEANPDILPAYYVQDYEPLFFEHGSVQWQAARDSYRRIPSAVLFAKTDWIANQIGEQHGLKVHKVAPSLDHTVYFPGPRSARPQVAVVAMVRPKTKRRGAERTVRVLSELAQRFPQQIAVHTFGCDAQDPVFDGLPRELPFTHHGQLNRAEVARLLRKSDIFVDLSDYQAFGRTGLEAMACGCAVVLPRGGGVGEYATNGANAVLVDTASEPECVSALAALLVSPDEQKRLREAGLLTAARFSVHQAAMTELAVFARGLATERVAPKLLPRIILLPSSNGGVVNASGWIRLMGVWRSSAVRSAWQVITASTALPAPRAVPQLAIVQPDAPAAAPDVIAAWAGAFREQGGKLVVDLDDTALFDPLQERVGRRPASRGRGYAEWLAQSADAVLVSSAARLATAKRLNQNAFVVPNGVDADLWKALLELCSRPVTPVAGGPIRVGYVGSSARRDDLRLVAGAANRLEAEYGQRIQIEVVGAYESQPTLFGSRVGLPRKTEYPQYLDWLQRRATWDIAVMPLRSSSVPPGDLELQWLQYSALGAVAVASDQPPLRELIRDGHSGLLVPNDEASWYEALKRLIDSHDLRQTLLAGARTDLALRTAAARSNRLETIEAIMSLPARTDRPVLPAHLRAILSDGLAGRDGERVAVARRKLAKLRRDPRGFFGDSKSAWLRGVGSLLLGDPANRRAR
jgi:GT2 family glycosyltransferase/glycosyltransferase involved in cell wall biosynthesis